MATAPRFEAAPPAVPAAPAIRPWDYIRLRREAAGLTIEQVATLLTAPGRSLYDAARHIRAIETAGIRCALGATYLANIFPFDPDIYHQLSVGAPHARLCESCGWDQWTEQTDIEGSSTKWSEADPAVCTRCEQIAAAGGRH